MNKLSSQYSNSFEFTKQLVVYFNPNMHPGPSQSSLIPLMLLYQITVKIHIQQVDFNIDTVHIINASKSTNNIKSSNKMKCKSSKSDKRIKSIKSVESSKKLMSQTTKLLYKLHLKYKKYLKYKQYQFLSIDDIKYQ